MSKTKRPSGIVEEVANDDYLDLPHEDYAAYCRLCFSITQLEPLFVSHHDENYQEVGIIEMCTGVKLSAKTDAPSSICLQCRLTLDEFVGFRRLCQRLNRIYRRKRNDMAVAKVSAALEYHPSIIGTEAVPSPALVEEETPTETSPEAAAIPDEPTPMDVGDETCATVVAPEPSAMEASADAPAEDEAAQGSFIVHELSDDDDVECTGVISLDTTPIVLTSQDDEPFIKMDDDWFCCKICSRMYQSFPLLAEHFRDIHPDKAALLRAKDKERFFVIKDSDLQMVKIGQKTFIKCDLCDTLFAQKRSISRHRWRYHGTFEDAKKSFCRVPGCGHFFMGMKCLSRHMGIVHGKEPDGKAVATAGDDDDVVVVTDSVEEVSTARMQVMYTSL